MEREMLRKAKVWNFVFFRLGIFGFILCLAAGSGISLAQEKYPAKPINFLIGFPPGGIADIGVRPLLTAAGKTLGQPFVVMHKPGGASAIAASILKNEKPDGYTLGILSTGAVLSQHLRKLPYDSARDFTPIMQYGVYEYGLVVRPDSPWNTFQEFIDYAKKNAGRIRYSTGGLGMSAHLTMERLAMQEKIKWVHIPFEGAVQAVPALMGGHVESCAETTVWKKHVESGRLRLLAVFSEKRMVDFPNVPTLLDLGYKIIAPSLGCIVGPKGIPPQIVATLHEALKRAMDDPDFLKVARQVDQPPLYRGPQELQNHLLEMNEEVESLVRNLGLRKE